MQFVDETSANTEMARRYGRSPRGQRLVGTAPHGHGKTTPFVAAPCLAGLVAPMVVDGAIDGDLLLAYVEQQLVPTLRPGGIAIMDDLSSQKRPKVREAIEEAGCRRLLLPPYSPDRSPIELAFSRPKAPLGKAGERTVDGLWELLGQAVEAFGPEECRNYRRHCGYDAILP